MQKCEVFIIKIIKFIHDFFFSRDSLAKEVYNKIFIWLVLRLNDTILPAQDMDESIDKATLNSSRYAVGLLDIFGFECFKVNSFEQLCINYTNEKLQQLFISYVFKAEENEFIIEGLKDFLCELNFVDNQGIIDLMDQYPMGVFNLLDESCSVAGDDDKLVNKIKITHAKNPQFIAPKINKETFIIIHTAKDVEYNIRGFREKNKDELGKTLQSVMENSKNKNIVFVFQIDENEDGATRNSKKSTSSSKFLSYKFRSQMKNLMNELQSCDCHFIRCLKANDIKKQNTWMGNLVLQQIQYLGVADSIKVRKESYPIRRMYKQFYERYDVLDENQKLSYPELVKQNADFKAIVQKSVLILKFFII